MCLNKVISLSLSLSFHCHCHKGVRQRFILDSLLFLIYINDIPNSSNLFNFLVYANDTTLWLS